LDRAIDRIDDFDWLILTSTNAVDYFFQRLEEVTGERAFYSNIKIAVVGEKTAQRLLKMGLEPDFMPPNFVADSLVAYFPEPLAGLRILFPRVESGGREVLVKEFTSQGAKVREVAAYESRCPETIAPAALKALQAGRVDVVTFASSKTVQHFCQLLQQVSDAWQAWLTGVTVASIGPQTSKACMELLGRVDVAAEEYTLDGLTQAIVDWFTPEPATAQDAAATTETETSNEAAIAPPVVIEPVEFPSTEADSSEANPDHQVLPTEPLTPAELRNQPEAQATSQANNVDLLEPIQVELVPTDHPDTAQAELVATEAELIEADQPGAELSTVEAELIAEIQAVIEQGEHAES
jgi:uroporphyrinogen-III synthase